jgi:hypothetical protein
LDGRDAAIYMKHYYKNEALFSDTKIVTLFTVNRLKVRLDPEMIKNNNGQTPVRLYLI